jgi:uncharacterized protein (DUF2384 family)
MTARPPRQRPQPAGQTIPRPDPSLVLARATVRTAGFLGLSGALLARTLGTSEATVSRILAGQRPIAPDSKSGELALLLVRLYRSLDALVGNDEALRRAWFESPNDALNGTPKDLIRTAQGLVTVVNYLDGMRAPL